jgi:HEAT repeat protein
LLEESLKCLSPRVRDGAGLGLSFMNDLRAIDSLKEAIQKEQSKLLRKNMVQVLEQLEGEL